MPHTAERLLFWDKKFSTRLYTEAFSIAPKTTPLTVQDTDRIKQVPPSF